MKSQLQTNYDEIEKKIKPKVILTMKRIYVIAFNFYSWFWLIREIFYRHSTDWENYILWFFTTSGMYYFVLDNNEIFFKNKSNEKRISNNM